MIEIIVVVHYSFEIVVLIIEVALWNVSSREISVIFALVLIAVSSIVRALVVHTLVFASAALVWLVIVIWHPVVSLEISVVIVSVVVAASSHVRDESITPETVTTLVIVLVRKLVELALELSIFVISSIVFVIASSVSIVSPTSHVVVSGVDIGGTTVGRILIEISKITELFLRIHVKWVHLSTISIVVVHPSTSILPSIAVIPISSTTPIAWHRPLVIHTEIHRIATIWSISILLVSHTGISHVSTTIHHLIRIAVTWVEVHHIVVKIADGPLLL